MYRNYRANKLAYLKLKRLAPKSKKKKRITHRKPLPVTISNQSGIVPAKYAPFPSQLKTKLRYCDTVSMTAVGGAAATYVFSASGIYDCDITGVGHQPMYRDTLAAQYNHYRVTHCRIQVFYNSGALANVALGTMICLRLDDDTSGPSTVTDAMENPRCRWKLCNNCPKYNDQIDLNTPLIMQFNAKKFFGDTYKNDTRSAAVGSNPSDQAYWLIDYFTTPGVATDVSINLTVCLDYDVIFSEPKDIPGS